MINEFCTDRYLGLFEKNFLCLKQRSFVPWALCLKTFLPNLFIELYKPNIIYKGGRGKGNQTTFAKV